MEHVLLVYEQIATWFLQQMESNELKGGELLPSETECWRRCAPSSPDRTIFTVLLLEREPRRICASACSSAQPTPSPAICGTPPETAASGRS